jgi:hypothetical protein
MTINKRAEGATTCFKIDKTKPCACAQMGGMPDNFAEMFKMMEQHCQKTECGSGQEQMMKDMGASCCGFAGGGALKNSEGEEKE